MTLVLAGLMAGFVHVLSGPDHLAAIAPYAVDGKSRAWRLENPTAADVKLAEEWLARQQAPAFAGPAAVDDPPS